MLLAIEILTSETVTAEAASSSSVVPAIPSAPSEALQDASGDGFKRARKMVLAAVSQAEQIACFLHHHALVSLSPFLIPSGDH
jgi:hypothetical protein